MPRIKKTHTTAGGNADNQYRERMWQQFTAPQANVIARLAILGFEVSGKVGYGGGGAAVRMEPPVDQGFIEGAVFVHTDGRVNAQGTRNRRGQAMPLVTWLEKRRSRSGDYEPNPVFPEWTPGDALLLVEALHQHLD